VPECRSTTSYPQAGCTCHILDSKNWISAWTAKTKMERDRAPNTKLAQRAHPAVLGQPVHAWRAAYSSSRRSRDLLHTKSPRRCYIPGCVLRAEKLVSRSGAMPCVEGETCYTLRVRTIDSDHGLDGGSSLSLNVIGG